MYATITNVINSWSCQARIAIDYFGSSGFIVPLIIFLLWVSCCSCCIDSLLSVITSVCAIRCLVCVWFVDWSLSFCNFDHVAMPCFCVGCCVMQNMLCWRREKHASSSSRNSLSWSVDKPLLTGRASALHVCILSSLLHSFAHILYEKLA